MARSNIQYQAEKPKCIIITLYPSEHKQIEEREKQKQKRLCEISMQVGLIRLSVWVFHLHHFWPICLLRRIKEPCKQQNEFVFVKHLHKKVLSHHKYMVNKINIIQAQPIFWLHHNPDRQIKHENNMETKLTKLTWFIRYPDQL